MLLAWATWDAEYPVAGLDDLIGSLMCRPGVRWSVASLLTVAVWCPWETIGCIVLGRDRMEKRGVRGQTQTRKNRGASAYILNERGSGEAYTINKQEQDG